MRLEDMIGKKRWGRKVKYPAGKRYEIEAKKEIREEYEKEKNKTYRDGTGIPVKMYCDDYGTPMSKSESKTCCEDEGSPI